MQLADVNDGATLAMRRVPRGLRYGLVGGQRDRLIVEGKVLTIVLVGRIAETRFHTDKPIASLHVMPLLDSDLATAHRLSGEDSIPPAQATSKYLTVRASCTQPKRGMQQAVYDVSGRKGIKPKDRLESYDVQEIEKGDLVALELNMKKFTNKAQFRQASFDFKAVLLLHKGKAEDIAIAKKALEPDQTESFSSSFYSDLSSAIKGKGKERG
ncbi:hypothetical protein M407DRAFT_32851 [Tulasnella calospora MUT 4182]|uniref:Uncharacterized protein n=1 Tax=Tulasnella calospora MUT 4182 TaxID=1051891 RepID=A0A0C3Q422_9AGAM|nr:hypothetical protein M407DRAFT_32851 [Tulasnella calospora MUT 4182]